MMGLPDARTSAVKEPAGLDAEDTSWPERRNAWIALLLLCAAAIASQLDRQIINLVVEPVKAEFGLSDGQFGMLQGIAFGLFYTFGAIPLGMLADRYQRRIVIGLGIGFFSIFSFATGLSRTYTQMFLSRVGVGVGEASLTPAGFSLISDYFPKRLLGRAISLFTMSNFIGTSLAFAIGGALLGLLDNVALVNPEALRGFDPWHLAFIFASLPGFLLAPCFFLLREPKRRGLVQGYDQKMPFSVVLRQLRSRASFLIPLALGMSMVTTVSYAIMTWTPALLIRVFDWNTAKVGLWMGAIVLVGSVSGSYFAGWLADKLTARGTVDAPIKVAMLSFVGCGVAGAAAPLMPTAELAMLLIFFVTFFKCQPLACAPIALQLAVPNQLRSQTSGIYLTVISLIGLIAGPVLVGVLSDQLFPGADGVRYSLALVIATSCPIMVGLLWLACRPYRKLVAASAEAA
jgi:MFS family permease